MMHFLGSSAQNFSMVLVGVHTFFPWFLGILVFKIMLEGLSGIHFCGGPFLYNPGCSPLRVWLQALGVSDFAGRQLSKPTRRCKN